MSESIQVQLGFPDTDGIGLSVIGRSHPGATDFWDGNWLRTRAFGRVGGFTVDLVADLRAEEFAQFRRGLERMYALVAVKASFRTLEAYLALDLHRDEVGHVRVEVELMDRPAIGNLLRCSIDIDLTYLPSIINSLDEILRRWPILGNR
jgi:hypothetical protein